jgi:cytochrome c oxidase cbb3-type subunit I/II
MYVSGVVQSLMWKEFNPEGFLVYKNFLETTVQILPLYLLRAIGGGLYLIGAIIMTYNLIKTAYAGSFLANEEAEAAPLSNHRVVGIIGYSNTNQCYSQPWHW